MLESARGLFVVGMALLAGCAGSQATSAGASADGTPAEQPAQEQGASPAAACAPETTKDYLGEGIVIVNPFGNKIVGPDKLTLGKILTAASDKTKGQYEVELVVNSPDWAAGDKLWTENVVMVSHPATADELKAGGAVLVSSWNPKDPSETRNGPWITGVVKSTDDLFKKQVSVLSLNTGKTELIYLHNIRVADDPKLEPPAQE